MVCDVRPVAVRVAEEAAEAPETTSASATPSAADV
jgi:hypothetical protein